MQIAIVGTRGIPNHYGGFEQFAEYLAIGLVEKGHKVTVYNSHNHPYTKDNYNGVDIKYIFDPEYKIGTAGQFVYDFLSILDTRKNHFDIILELGYTSSSVSFGFHPNNSIVVTNMDGLEWKRTKFSKKVQRFLLWAESLAVKKSNHLVSDSIGIQNYLKEKYKINSTYIPYGAHIFENEDISILDKYNLKQYSYNMLIARLEPENSIEIILNGIVNAENKIPFLVIGNHKTSFGKYLKDKFKLNNNIKFIGGIYDINILNNLRYFSNIYFHGHTVGGTNPSLLEAMASSALICANNNEFNSTILSKDAFYFTDAKDITRVLNNVLNYNNKDKIKNNLEKIKNLYTWDIIIEKYENLFIRLLS